MNEKLDLKKIFGIIFSITGTVLLLFAAYALLKGGSNLFGTVVDGYKTLVPIVLGLIFFTSGIKLIK